MAEWQVEHHAFAVETFLKVVISIYTTQRLFRNGFNVGVHGRVPDRSTISNRVKLLEPLPLHKRIGGSVKTVCMPENMERVRATVTLA